MTMSAERVKAAIRDVPDFPKPGIIFKDLTPVLNDPELFRESIDLIEEPLKKMNVSKVACVDARGFIFGAAVADRMGLGFVPIRKKGKLPYMTYERSYELEYGSATLSVHRDAFASGERVAIVDDLLATGGTAGAAAELIAESGAVMAGMVFLVELAFLKGRDKLPETDVVSAIVF